MSVLKINSKTIPGSHTDTGTAQQELGEGGKDEALIIYRLLGQAVNQPYLHSFVTEPRLAEQTPSPVASKSVTAPRAQNSSLSTLNPQKLPSGNSSFNLLIAQNPLSNFSREKP